VEGDGANDVVLFATDIDGKMIALEYNTSTSVFSDQITRYDGGALTGETDEGASSIAEGFGTTITPLRGQTSAEPVVVTKGANPESVFMVGQFRADSLDDNREGDVTALVAFDPNLNSQTGRFIVRKATSWGELVQFVLKLSDSSSGAPKALQVLAPTIANGALVVTVPGQRLYALDVEELQN